MDLIAWIGRLAFFLLALWLALENTGPVPIRLSASLQWPDVPLVAVILLTFLAGVVAGSLALVPRLVRLSRLASRPAPSPAQAHQAAELALTQAARQAGAAGELEVDSRLAR
jgi:uncharacterized integral membrane protein